MRVLRGVAAAMFLLGAAPVAAQEAGALPWLSGRWQGPGTMFGNPSEAVLEVSPTTTGFDLRYRAGRFEGRAAYRPIGGGRWQASWTDNRGVSFPIAAIADGQVLTSDWGSAETERGRTVYRLLEDGSLELVDTVATQGGETREFARHRLVRANSAE